MIKVIRIFSKHATNFKYRVLTNTTSLSSVKKGDLLTQKQFDIEKTKDIIEEVGYKAS